MKVALKIILLVVLSFVLYGFYTNSNEAKAGEKFIGVGVLLFAFILMPLFIYHRYNGKDLSRYSIKNMFPQNKEKDN